jgi:lipopolysaccharide transport system permease protein
MPLNSALRDIWAFRGLIWSTVKRELQSKWSGTQLGPFWIVAQPLATILIFTVIFAEIMKPSLPRHDAKFAYSIYLCAGILGWNFFAELLGRCVGVFVENATLLKKVNFPKICLPVICLISSLLHFGIIFILFYFFLLLAGSSPGWVTISVVPVLLVQIAFTSGLGILLGTVNVFYRDIQQAIGLFLQFWFWLTPIVYLPSGLPDIAFSILRWNPMLPIIQGYQSIFLEQTFPDWTGLIYPGVLAVILCIAGIWTFRRLQGEIVDEL